MALCVRYFIIRVRLRAHHRHRAPLLQVSASRSGTEIFAATRATDGRRARRDRPYRVIVDICGSRTPFLPPLNFGQIGKSMALSNGVDGVSRKRTVCRLGLVPSFVLTAAAGAAADIAPPHDVGGRAPSVRD